MVHNANLTSHQFKSGSQPLHVTSRWLDGDVVLSLTSPSGRVIDRDTEAPDVTHELGPTFESYHLTSPEPGTWTATLYGARVEPGGADVRLNVYQAPEQHNPPVVAIQQTFDGRTVNVDAIVTPDPDAEIVDYLWEFGDGAVTRSPTARTTSHTYTDPGIYLVTLAVQDNRGRWGFASGPTTIHVR